MSTLATETAVYVRACPTERNPVTDYTVVPVADVPDVAAEVGMDPDHFEIRFMREPLGLKNLAVTYERFGGGWRAPEGHPHRRGHRHTIQEEVYFLISGRAQASSTARSSTSSPGQPCGSRRRRLGRFGRPARR